MFLYHNDVCLRTEHPPGLRTFFAEDQLWLLTNYWSFVLPQVIVLGETAERLNESHPDATDDLQRQRMELNEAWNDLLECTEDRKENLSEAKKFYLFLSKAR